MRAGAKLPMNFDPWGNPWYRGVRVETEKDGITHVAWWISNGHWLAREERCDGGSALEVLCSALPLGDDTATAAWHYGGSGVKPLPEKDRAVTVGLIKIPDGSMLFRLAGLATVGVDTAIQDKDGNDFEAEYVSSLRVCVMLESHDDKHLRSVNAGYIEPFLDCDWMAPADPSKPLCAVRDGEIQGVIMGTKSSDEFLRTEAEMLSIFRRDAEAFAKGKEATKP